MLEVQSFTDDPIQQQSLTLPDGTIIDLIIKYVPLQYGWFIENLTYGTFTLNGIRISNNPNMLRQWSNKIPFGLACFSTANREPTQQQDFASGASKLYVLTSDEVLQYEEYLSGS